MPRTQMAAAHFTAETGGIHYKKVENSFLGDQFSSETNISLNPLDGDEGQFMTSEVAYSTSDQKK